jgi:hypothetical protein
MAMTGRCEDGTSACAPADALEYAEHARRRNDFLHPSCGASGRIDDPGVALVAQLAGSAGPSSTRVTRQIDRASNRSRSGQIASAACAAERGRYPPAKIAMNRRAAA